MLEKNTISGPKLTMQRHLVCGSSITCIKKLFQPYSHTSLFRGDTNSHVLVCGS